MKDTGMIRRMDELGRVVIPKEIRDFLYIGRGEPLEIFTENNMVCFKKHDTREGYVNTLTSIISGVDSVIDVVKKEELKKKLGEAVELLNAK